VGEEEFWAARHAPSCSSRATRWTRRWRPRCCAPAATGSASSRTASSPRRGRAQASRRSCARAARTSRRSPAVVSDPVRQEGVWGTRSPSLAVGPDVCGPVDYDSPAPENPIGASAIDRHFLPRGSKAAPSRSRPSDRSQPIRPCSSRPTRSPPPAD